MREEPNDQTSLEDATERLFAQFDGHIPLPQIVVVRQARSDLAGSQPTALPELIERLTHLRPLEASADSPERDDTA